MHTAEKALVASMYNELDGEVDFLDKELQTVHQASEARQRVREGAPHLQIAENSTQEGKVKLLSLRLSLAILLACAVMAVCSSSAAAKDAAATYYKAKCAMCHGADGKGGKRGTKDFTPDIQGMTDAKLTEVLTKCTAPKMPAHEEKLKESDIKGLVAYIRTLGKK